MTRRPPIAPRGSSGADAPAAPARPVRHHGGIPAPGASAPGAGMPAGAARDFERGAMLAACMQELPAIHREVLTLRFEEDMQLEQIAEVAGIPLSTVKSRLRRALEGLRAAMHARIPGGGRA